MRTPNPNRETYSYSGDKAFRRTGAIVRRLFIKKLTWVNKTLILPRRIIPCFPLPGLGAIIIHEDAIRGTFQILHLAALQRPPEDRANHKDQQDGDRNQEIETFHASSANGYFCNRKAFMTTSRELADMPMPAIQGVTQPAMARGIAITL